MTEELNPTGDEALNSSNPAGDSEDEDLDFLDEIENEPDESQEPEGSEKALKVFNEELKKRGLNKNYKSWDDVAKSEKQRDIAFAKKGMEEPKKELKKEELSSNPSERLLISELQLKIDSPDSKYILDDIKKEHPGKDPYEIWNSSEYYKKEAAIRAENERNKERIANPSNNSEGKPEEDGMSKKFMKNFPPGFEQAMKKMKA